MNTHVIRVVRNTARLVTADSVRDTDRCDFLTDADAADFAETIVAGFPWGWSCSCGLTATAYRDAETAAFNAPDEHRHVTGHHDQVLVLDPDGGGTDG